MMMVMRPAGSFLNECSKQRWVFSADKDDFVMIVFHFHHCWSLRRSRVSSRTDGQGHQASKTVISNALCQTESHGALLRGTYVDKTWESDACT
jgi:hypothetical protein